MKDSNEYKYLGKINSPEELKALRADALPCLAEEIRRELISRVTKNGGHLASNLGIVELTLAIHRVFSSPHDHIIFDVGHQSYVHKMLTGRFDKMETLRTPGGLSGFTNIFESEHDAFGAGHSSTSLSAGLGFAISDKLAGRDNYTVVVLGDGAYTGGMIHEALNNCRKDLNLIIILNENEISISKNIGKFAEYLARVRIRASYFKTKKATGAFLKNIPLIGEPLFRGVRGIKQGLKNILYDSNYFESMGLTYLGPVDGNDLEATQSLLRDAKKLGESVFVHVRTKKGKGYEPAENEPSVYHGISPAKPVSAVPAAPSFSEMFGNALSELAERDTRVCAITAAMSDGTGLGLFKEKFKERFFDVGIAEEHALTFAAGLAANGERPFVAVYSTFLQRAYDNLIHDIALQRLPVTLCIDRAGLNPSDGATHHGIFDVAMICSVPNMTLYTPLTQKRLGDALSECLVLGECVAVRYPKGRENGRIKAEFYSREYKKALGAVANFDKNDVLDALVITDGAVISEAFAASDKARERGKRVGIILLEKIKPFSECAENITALMPEKKTKLIFLEEEMIAGGMGMNISSELMRMGALAGGEFTLLGVRDSFVPRSVGKSVYEDARISAEDILKIINDE